MPQAHTRTSLIRRVAPPLAQKCLNGISPPGKPSLISAILPAATYLHSCVCECSIQHRAKLMTYYFNNIQRVFEFYVCDMCG